jgi:hypothetical protein
MWLCSQTLGFRQPWAWTFELRIPTFGLGLAQTCDYIIGDYDFCDRGKHLLRFSPDSVRPRLETVLSSETTNRSGPLWSSLVSGDYKPLCYLDYKDIWCDLPIQATGFPRSHDHGGLALAEVCFD